MFANFANVRGSLAPGAAKDVLERTGLPTSELSRIWHLSDMDRDGRLTLGEFVCAMHLASARVRGTPLPVTLPGSLAASCMALERTREAAMSVASDISVTSRSEQPSPGDLSIQTPPFASTPSEQAGGDDEGVERLKPEEILLFSGIFQELDARREGIIDADAAKSVLERTNLPSTELAQLWHVADADADGWLTRGEFVCAMHLAACRNRGQPLPQRLPRHLAAEAARLDGRTGAAATAAAEPPPAVAEEPATWFVSPRETVAFVNMFDHLDAGGVGSLGAHDARRALETTQLPVSDLSDIWHLSDVDADGRLTRGEFLCAMHLASNRRRGVELPETLPQDLIDICIAAEDPELAGRLAGSNSVSD